MLLILFLFLTEQVGTYDPIANKAGIKEVTFKVEKIRYWMGVGAKPSDRVAWLLGQVSYIQQLYGVDRGVRAFFVKYVGPLSRRSGLTILCGV